MTEQSFTYLDHAATSPVLPEVLDAMMPWLTTDYGNPSSVYGKGRKARHALESCRTRIADLLGVGPAEIIFTSGGSESNNTVLAPDSAGARGVITSSVEHEAVLEPTRLLAHHRILTPDSSGRITVDQLSREAGREYGLASFMLVNNEVGTINPVAELGRWCRDNDMLIHTDAAQAARTVDLRPVTAAVDYLSLTGHKFGAPKGVGLLYARAGMPFSPLIRGGGQEQERRSGTENVAFVAGMTKALELAVSNREDFVSHARRLRATFLDSLAAHEKGHLRIISPTEGSTPHILNFLVRNGEDHGVDGEMLILGLDIEGVAVSAGSACSSGTMKASHVMEALHIRPEEARGVLRISFGPQTTEGDVLRAARALDKVMKRMGK